MKRTGQLALVLALAACKGRDDHSSHDRPTDESPAAMSADFERDESTGEAGSAMALEEGRMGKKDSSREDGQYKMRAERAMAPPMPATVGVMGGFGDAVLDNKAVAQGDPGATATTESAPTRAWFPETFLFEPLVVTDATGMAQVSVKVPDRLTTWRVLALAHSRSGAQGGAVTSFLGTLPVYVDPIVPPTLVIGDEVRLPIQVVNTTDAAVTSQLATSATNAALSGGSGSRTAPAQGSLVEYATLKATKPGVIELTSGLAGADSVVRTIEVLPAGQPVEVTRSGTLASERTLTIEGPTGSDPATDRVRLVVFPGALALVRAELGVSTARQGLAEDAYALMLAGRAPALVTALGDKPDTAALRDLTIIAGQRIVRAARTLDTEQATLIAAAALAHPQNPVLSRLGERAADTLARAQRPDGTFAGGSGWTLQRVLAATAESTNAVRAAMATPEQQQRAQGVTLRAGSAFARNAEQVTDAYTAALMLSTGAVDGALADTLRERVRAACVDGGDGTKYLKVEPDIVRADGLTPSRVEATAIAVLALEEDPKSAALLADLGATLLSGYSLYSGWGDGRANMAAMQAVTQLFDQPLPDKIDITLKKDGAVVIAGTYDRAKLRDVLVLPSSAPGVSGAHEYQVSSTPPIAGLGFSLQVEGFVPWSQQAVSGGLELQLPMKLAGQVGKPVDIAITAIAPQGMELHLTQALPAGVQVDTPSLQKLVDAGVIARFETADGRVELFVAALSPGQVFTATYRAIPTLAGTLHGAASKIESGSHEHWVPPTTWTIRP